MGAATKFSDQQLNYFRICCIVTDVIAEGLRTIFKQEWDNRYKATLGEWKDEPRNGLDFFNGESLRNQRKNANLLGTMINGNRADWDCTMLFYAILYSDCIGNGLNAVVRSNVDDLRKFRNEEWARNPRGYLSDLEFHRAITRIDVIFRALGLSTLRIQEICAFNKFSDQQLNYFRICCIVTDVIAEGLRTIFKQEWDNRYKATLGEWKDEPRNGLDFFNGESLRNQRKMRIF